MDPTDDTGAADEAVGAGEVGPNAEPNPEAGAAVVAGAFQAAVPKEKDGAAAAALWLDDDWKLKGLVAGAPGALED